MSIVDNIKKIKDIAPDIAMMHVDYAETHNQTSADLLFAHYELVLDLVHVILMVTEKTNSAITTETFLDALCADVIQNEKMEKHMEEELESENSVKGEEQ